MIISCVSPLYIKYMESYSNFISQFEIFNNPRPKRGFHRHHIVPKSKQTEKDERCVYLLPSQHLWAHILYDREHGTKTATRLKNFSQVNPTCYEDCIVLDEKDRKLREEISERVSGEGNPMYGVRLCGTDNPNYGKPTSDETKEKISETQKQRYRNGVQNPMKGKHHTETTKRKLSEQRKGKHPTEEARKHMGDSHRGFKHSEESIKKMKENSYWKGRHHSEEQKKKWSEERKGIPVPEERKAQMSESHKGLLWWNNGEITKQSRECPGEGWVRGRLKTKPN